MELELGLERAVQIAVEIGTETETRYPTYRRRRCQGRWISRHTRDLGRCEHEVIISNSVEQFRSIQRGIENYIIDSMILLYSTTYLYIYLLASEFRIQHALT